MTEVAKSPHRLLAIDAMRGIAALLVVFFHVQGAFARAPQPWMPEWLAAFFSSGHYGVNIFFVLSGFVIALSLRAANFSGRFVGQFTLRRSIRLDPPLWSAILLETLLVWLSIRFFPSQVSASMPTLKQMAANAVYLQGFLGFEHVSPVFWTLCYEIQFYLTLVLLLVGADALGRRFSVSFGQRVLAAVLLVLFVASLATRGGVLTMPRGLALERWSEFCFGSLTFWAVSGRIPRWVPVVAAVAILLALSSIGHQVESLVTISSGIGCAASYLSPAFNRAADVAPLQWLGRISYSLYLFHGSIGYRTVSLGQYVLGKTLTAVTGPLLWMAALGSAIIVSAIMWRLVEVPALNLSRRIKLTG